MRTSTTILVALASVAALAPAHAGKTTRLTKGADDAGVNLFFGPPSISANGRFVAFAGNPAGVVPEDQDGNSDVFVRDLKKKTTTRVSAPAGGGAADGWSHDPSISADGRFVAFTSAATNLPLGGLNSEVDVFVHDRATGETELISVKWAKVGELTVPLAANGA